MKTQLCFGLNLTNPLYNSSCPIAVTYKQLDELESSWSGAVLTKSATILPNELKDSSVKRYEYDLDTKNSYNRNGLLNPGLDYYLNYDKKKSDKPYIISVALNKPEEYHDLVFKLNWENHKTIPDSIELNLSCPNHSDKDDNYFQKLGETLKLISLDHSKMPILGLKLRPCLEISEINYISKLIRRCIKIKYIVCSNTIPRGISPNGFIGAVGGSSLKPIALWNVYEYRRRLSSDIGIIGCGGVFKPRDLYQYMKSGACAVQIGTGIYEHGLGSIQAILRDYELNLNKSSL